MQQFDCVYGFTDKMVRLGEDDLLAAMSKQIAQRTTFVNELQVFGTLKGGTNAFYGGTGTSRATTNGGLSLNMIRKIIRSLDANHTEEITEVLAAGTKYGTTPVEGGYFFYGHSDLAPDCRDITGFAKAVEYASGTPMMGELGMAEKVRFMLSPEFAPIIDGGASVASTPGFQSTNGVNNDAYPFVICGADAWSSVAVRGMEAMKINLHMPESSATDIHGQRGYTGAVWWKATLIENNFWMAVGYVLAKSLPN